MTVEALEDGVYLSFSGEGLSYSIDEGEWTVLQHSENTPTINIGQSIKLKGKNIRTGAITYFSINGRCKLSGTIMSLVYGDAPYEQTIPMNVAFSNAFYGCPSIVEVSSDFLPATTLTNACYMNLFRGCTELTTAPDLPATELVDNCYYGMFQGCTKLNYIKMLATDISASNCLNNWVNGVASSGTFVKNKNATWNVTGDSGVPSGWTIQTV